MKDSYRDAYGTAIIYAHARQLADSTITVEQLMNDNSPEAIALAEQYLKDLKPNIAGWEADFGKEMMTKNKAWLNLTWSGDAVWAMLDMMEILDNDPSYDAVACYQKNRKESKVLSAFKNAFYKTINKVSEIEFKSGASDFRLLRRCVVDAVLSMSEYHRFSKGIFSWVGFNTFYMPYVVEDRASGTSKWSFGKLFKYAIDGIIAFTTMPLKIATYIGLISSAASIIYMIVVIIQKLAFDINIPGYATIVVLILLLGGLQLFCIGMVGEYLARTYIESKHRPIYIAREVLDYEDK